MNKRGIATPVLIIISVVLVFIGVYMIGEWVDDEPIRVVECKVDSDCTQAYNSYWSCNEQEHVCECLVTQGQDKRVCEEGIQKKQEVITCGDGICESNELYVECLEINCPEGENCAKYGCYYACEADCGDYYTPKKVSVNPLQWRGNANHDCSKLSTMQCEDGVRLGDLCDTRGDICYMSDSCQEAVCSDKGFDDEA